MGVSRYKDHFESHTTFYRDAAAGALPAFSWLNCKEEAADHPCSDMAGLDEGLLSLRLPTLVCVENPYRKTNGSDEWQCALVYVQAKGERCQKDIYEALRAAPT